MKKLLCVLLALLLALPCLGALAEPRYPRVSAPVTDAAAVLSTQTVADLRAFNKQLEEANPTDPGSGGALNNLVVVTVDFLDGQNANDYAFALFNRAGLTPEDILLLLVVGEDRYECLLGSRLLPLGDVTLNKLLATELEPLFMQQRYDEAIAAFIPAFCDEVNKACGVSLSTAGLFGREAAPAVTAAPAAKWADAYQAATDKLNHLWDQDAWSEKLDEGSRERGIGLGGVIVIVFILMLVFGRKDRRRRRRRRRGVTPMKVVAGIGLFALLRRFFSSKD